MQNFAQIPIFSDVADVFYYPALTGAGAGDSIDIAAPGGTGQAYITLQPQHYFAFTAFASVTNYDNAGGVFATGDSTAILAMPSVPNNFLVSITRGSQNNYSNLDYTQAELCSSGLLSGKQNPYPIIYGPALTLTFKFTDLTSLYLLDGDDAAIPLSIRFWMKGYAIPQDKWPMFLEYFPGLQAAYQ